MRKAPPSPEKPMPHPSTELRGGHRLRRGPGLLCRRARRRRLGLCSTIAAEALLGGARVALEAFDARERDGVAHGGCSTFGVVDAHPRAHAQKVEHREAARVARRARGRQRVVRADAVVAEDLGRARADEEAAVVVAARGDGVGVGADDFQVLGRHGVRHRDGLGGRRAGDGEAAAHGGLGNSFCRERGELLVELLVDARDDRQRGGLLRFRFRPAAVGRRREGGEDGSRDDVVLGLGEEVGRDDGRVGGFVGDDQHLGRPGEHVDADARLDRADRLGGRDPLVAGPADDVGARDVGERADGERRDGVRAAELEEVVGARDVRGREREWPGPRARDDDRRDARGLGGHGGHEYRGRQRVPPAGGVAARDADGLHRVARLTAGYLERRLAQRVALCFGKSADSLGDAI
mmetsp:Transcript_16801/g.67793  ORF Transcript_16801/g.67793 Transcript_16801/m.67793 type:complete len:407 (+) Transcript_16801:1705-2925(+)